MADQTYAQIIARVTGNLNRDDLDTKAREAIQERIEHYGKEFFYSAETLDTSITTTAGTRYYPLPTRWAAVNAVSVLSGNSIPLDRKSNAEMDEFDTLVTAPQGRPAYWCLFGGQLRIYECGAGYNLELTMDKSPAAPSADGDINFWTTDAQTLIVEAACESICNEYTNDPVRAEKHKTRRLEAELSLNSKSIRAKGGVNFRPYLF